MNLFYRTLKKHKRIHRLYIKLAMSKFMYPVWMLRGIFLHLPIAIFNSWRFPQIQSTDKFIVAKEFKASGLIYFKAPFTDGFENLVLPKGTILENCRSVPGATGFGCLPRNKDEFEKIAVPEHTRNDQRYSGYQLVIEKKNIGKNIERI